MTKNKSSKPTPASKSTATSARSRTRERREERQKQKRRQQQIGLLIGVVVVAVVAVGVFILSNLPASAPIPEGTLERYAGIPQTISDEGFPVLGRPDAPVRVEEFSSFACPGCQQFHETAFEGLLDFVREGIISFTYIPMATGGLSNQEGSARAAICASEQGRFFEYHDMLFDWHAQYGNQAFIQNRLTSGADALGLDRAAFNECLGSSGVVEIRAAAEDRFASTQGVTGTPALLVQGNIVANELSAISAAIQQALVASGQQPVPLELNAPEGEATPEAEAQTESETEGEVEATPEATTEGS